MNIHIYCDDKFVEITALRPQFRPFNEEKAELTVFYHLIRIISDCNITEGSKILINNNRKQVIIASARNTKSIN